MVAPRRLNPGLFHSCRLPEVIGAVGRAQQQFAGLPLHLVGFSLGGNFLLRVAAAAPQAGLRIASVVAISPVLEPRVTLNAIEAGLGVYQRYFLRKWSASLHAKQRAWPQLYQFSDLAGFSSLRKMTAALVARYTGFKSLEEYLDGYSITGRRLAGLTVPSTIITAVDDPIVPVADVTRLAASANLRALVTPFGGHCGFLNGLSGDTWAENAVVAQLTR